MKLRMLSSLLIGLVSLGSILSGQNAPIILPTDDPETGPPLRVIWPTEPGIRYILEESTNLQNWDEVEGFPSEAAALAQQHAFEIGGDRRFFRVIELDEQPPEIVTKSPDDGAIAVGRFSPIIVNFSDRSGLDPESVSLSIAGLGDFSIGDDWLTLDSHSLSLSFDTGGDVALGGYDETVTVQLDVADPLGNATSFEWTFRLEQESIYADNLFIFGSPDAQRAGQQIGAIPTRVLAQRWADGEPIRMNTGASDWTLVEVDEDFIRISYTDNNPPVFEKDQYVINLTPVSLDEIFNRKVTAIQDDPQTETLTLQTEEVSLAEIVPQGSFRLTDQDIAFEVGEDGVITRAVAIKSHAGRHKLEPIGINWDGKAVFGTYNVGPSTLHQFGLPLPDSPDGALFWNSRLVLDQGRLTVTPVLDLEFETRPWVPLPQLHNLHANMSLEVEWALEPRYQFFGSSINLSRSNTLWEQTYVIPLGKSWIDVKPKLDLNVGFQAGLTGEVSAGTTGDFSPYVVIDFDRALPREDRLRYDHGIRDHHFNFIPPDVALDGDFSAYAQLVPRIDLMIKSLAGLYVDVNPKLSATGSASMSDEQLTQAQLEAKLDAHLSAGFTIRWLGDVSWLPDLEPVRLFEPWTDDWSWPEHEDLRFTQHPQSTAVTEGQTLVLSVSTTGGPPGKVRYTWFKDGELYKFGGDTLRMTGANQGVAGEYYVRAQRGDERVDSNTATVVVESATTRIIRLSGNLSFGSATEGYSSQRTMTIHNDGNSSLHVTGISYPIGFSGDWSEGTIAGGDSREVAVTFAPDTAQNYGGTVTVFSNRTSGTNTRTISGTGVESEPPPEEMVRVSGGTLSTSNALDGTEVETFYIGKYPVTWGGWKAVREQAAERGYDIDSVGAGCADDHPVHSVNWYDVIKWCNLKSEIEGLTPVYSYNGSTYRSGQPTPTSISQDLSADGYRLPPEAEWEFAARGGNQTNGYTYAGSNDLDTVGWYLENSGGAACDLWDGHGTWPVGQKASNELGLYDMSGNVWEWVWDVGFVGIGRRIRGGSWFQDAAGCAVSKRNTQGSADDRYFTFGFRLARSSTSESDNPQITSIYPNPVLITMEDNQRSIHIQGANFAVGAEVWIWDETNADGPYEFSLTERADRYTRHSANHIEIEPYLSKPGDVFPASWSLFLVNPDGGYAFGSFEVREGEPTDFPSGDFVQNPADWTYADVLPAIEVQALNDFKAQNYPAWDWDPSKSWKDPVEGMFIGHPRYLAVYTSEGEFLGYKLTSLGWVSQIHLFDSGLSGEISTSLDNLENLYMLELSFNELSGEIPSSLGNLDNLYSLLLGQNNLSGEIPESLSNLANLRHIDLGHNQLSGEIPPSLGNLTSLDYLWLDYNELTGEIPSTFGNLANLRELYLHNNNLSGEIPFSLGNLPKLEWLTLENNQLSGSVRSDENAWPSLTLFRLQNNQFDDAPGSGFSSAMGILEQRIDNLVWQPQAQVGIPQITSIEPDLIWITMDDNQRSIHIHGTNFAVGVEVWIWDETNADGPYEFSLTERADRYTRHSANHIEIEPHLSKPGDVFPASWQLTVVNPGGESAFGSFEVRLE